MTAMNCNCLRTTKRWLWVTLILGAYTIQETAAIMQKQHRREGDEESKPCRLSFSRSFDSPNDIYGSLVPVLRCANGTEPLNPPPVPASVVDQGPSLPPSSEELTKAPTLPPSRVPTRGPTPFPSQQPTDLTIKAPSARPTEQPSPFPTLRPMEEPSPRPTKQLLALPTSRPSQHPTETPSPPLTTQPTNKPTELSTEEPAPPPTPFPSLAPTANEPTKKSSGVSSPTSSLSVSQLPLIPPVMTSTTESPVGVALSGHPTLTPTSQDVNIVEASPAPTSPPTYEPTTKSSGIPHPSPSLSVSQLPLIPPVMTSTTASPVGVDLSGHPTLTPTSHQDINIVEASPAPISPPTNEPTKKSSGIPSPTSGSSASQLPLIPPVMTSTTESPVGVVALSGYPTLMPMSHQDVNIVEASPAPTSLPTNIPTSTPTDVSMLLPTLAAPTTPSPTALCGTSVGGAAGRIKHLRVKLIEVLDPSTELSWGTPEYNAFQWLVHHDSFQICPGDTNVVQRYVLALLYFRTNGDSWTKCTRTGDTPCEGASFLSDSHDCTWGGIACDDQGVIRKINVDQSNLQGPIPTELGALTTLVELGLDENALTGSIPSELGALPNLMFLDFDNNALTGEIPEEIYTAGMLRSLDLDSNFLMGSISTNIGQLSHLLIAQFDMNQMTGPIPSEVGSLSDLSFFTITGNNFTDSIPAELCDRVTSDGLELYANCELCTTEGCCSGCL